MQEEILLQIALLYYIIYDNTTERSRIQVSEMKLLKIVKGCAGMEHLIIISNAFRFKNI